MRCINNERCKENHTYAQHCTNSDPWEQCFQNRKTASHALQHAPLVTTIIELQADYATHACSQKLSCADCDYRPAGFFNTALGAALPFAFAVLFSILFCTAGAAFALPLAATAGFFIDGEESTTSSSSTSSSLAATTAALSFALAFPFGAATRSMNALT